MLFCFFQRNCLIDQSLHSKLHMNAAAIIDPFTTCGIISSVENISPTNFVLPPLPEY